MPDVIENMTKTTPPAPTPGALSSEFALTKALIIVGIVLQTLAGALASLPASAASARWAAVASLVCGTALQVLSALGYVKSRTAVKVAEAGNP